MNSKKGLHLRPVNGILNRILLIGLLTAFVACERDSLGTRWDIDTAVPVAKGTVNLIEAIPDSIISTDSDGRVSLTYKDELLAIRADSLFNLPDTTTEDFYTFPIGPIDFPPGYVLFSDTQNTRFDISGVNLKEAVIRSGTINLVLTGTIAGATEFTFEIPGATKNGQPLTQTAPIPAGSFSNPSTITIPVDMTGYTLDLRGLNQDRYNTLEVRFQLRLDPNGPIVTVSPGEYFRMNITYAALVPEVLRGQFLQRTEAINETEAVELFEGLNSGSILLDRMNLDMRITNEVGSDIRVTINSLESRNTFDQTGVELQHTSIGSPINLTRAEENPSNTPPVKGFSYDILFTDQNSNITDFLGVLPNELAYDIDLFLNPLGSSSNGNDFLYYGTGLDLRIDATIPLSVTAENVMFSDTSRIEALDDNTEDELDYVLGGDLTVFIENDYPFDITSTFVILDSNKVPMDTLLPEPVTTPGGIPGTNGRVDEPAVSDFKIMVDPDRLDLLNNGGYLVYRGIFNTVNLPQSVTIYDDYKLNYRISGLLEYRVRIGT